MKKILIIAAAAVAALVIARSLYEQGRNREMIATLQTWMGKEVTCPSTSHFIIGDTTVLTDKDGYTILHCIDSTGCTSCKLHLDMWVHCQAPINTFLLDGENKIITIGNPLVNNKVKSNYYKLILTSR